jgi:hypothetical protein
MKRHSEKKLGKQWFFPHNISELRDNKHIPCRLARPGLRTNHSRSDSWKNSISDGVMSFISKMVSSQTHKECYTFVSLSTHANLAPHDEVMSETSRYDVGRSTCVFHSSFMLAQGADYGHALFWPVSNFPPQPKWFTIKMEGVSHESYVFRKIRLTYNLKRGYSIFHH